VYYFVKTKDYTNALIVVLSKMNYFKSSTGLNDYLSYYAVDIVINIGSYHFHSCYLCFDWYKCCLLLHFDGCKAHYFLNSY
jgi:hypothetical protein